MFIPGDTVFVKRVLRIVTVCGVCESADLRYDPHTNGFTCYDCGAYLIEDPEEELA